MDWVLFLKITWIFFVSDTKHSLFQSAKNVSNSEGGFVFIQWIRSGNVGQPLHWNWTSQYKDLTVEWHESVFVSVFWKIVISSIRWSAWMTWNLVQSNLNWFPTFHFYELVEKRWTMSDEYQVEINRDVILFRSFSTIQFIMISGVLC